MGTYRKNVAAILMNHNHQIWIGERADHIAWGFPQGGIELGESPEAALKRELMEELATNDFEIINKYPGWLRYDFPAGMTFETWDYAGQEQQYFLVKLHEGAVIDLEKYDHEFAQYRYVDFEALDDKQFGFKAELYRTVLNYFKNDILR